MKYMIIFFLACIFNLQYLLSNSEPDFLIIGAMKCGTTSLYQYLIQHPQIQSAAKKEISFFDNSFANGIDWYKSHFPNKPKDTITGEATPSYLLYPFVPERVFKLFPKIKLIILLCNPVKRAISHFYYFLRENHIKKYGKLADLNFEDALQKEYSRVTLNINNMINNQPYNLQYVRLYSYLTRGLYLEQILRWTKFFPKEQMLFIISEELYSNPQKTINKVFKFLGLPDLKLNKYTIFNKNKIKKNVKIETIKWLYNYYKKPNEELEKYLNIKLPWKSQMHLSIT